jgi:PAS domain-containing protein
MIFWKKKNKEESDPYKTLIIGAENDNAGRIRVSAIINYLNDGILVFDEKNQLSLINAQAEKFLEVKKEEVLGQSILKLNPFLNFRPLVSILGGDVREVFRKDIQLKENLILEVILCQDFIMEVL